MSESNPPISPLVWTSEELNNIIHVGVGQGGRGLWEKAFGQIYTMSQLSQAVCPRLSVSISHTVS